MRYFFIFFIICVYMFSHTNGLHNEFPWRQNINGIVKSSPSAVSVYSYEEKSISDVWNKIKQTALKVWDAIKDLAQSTKDKVNAWIEKLKERADKIIKQLKLRLDELKEKVLQMVQDIIGYGEKVKECIKKDKENIDIIIKEVTKNVTVCIANRIKAVNLIAQNERIKQENETAFIKDAENKYYVCIKNTNNPEECEFTVKKEIYKELDKNEDDIIDSQLQTRNFLDKLLDDITTCAVEGLTKASGAIISKALDILQCAKDDVISHELLIQHMRKLNLAII